VAEAPVVPGSAVAATITPPATITAAPDRAELRLELPSDIPGWLATIGSALAVAGFVLPWATRMPFTTGRGGYTDLWGLAASSHWSVLAVTAGLLVLSLLPRHVPPWIRAGVVPLALGGMLLGLVWPFVMGQFGSDIGSLGVALAAVMLIGSGLLGLRPRRHAATRSAV
jgi:hypothetical protein